MGQPVEKVTNLWKTLYRNSEQIKQTPIISPARRIYPDSPGHILEKKKKMKGVCVHERSDTGTDEHRGGKGRKAQPPTGL